MKIETTLMALIYLMLFFELFEGLKLVMCEFVEKNLSCYIGLNSFDEIFTRKQVFYSFL